MLDLILSLSRLKETAVLNSVLAGIKEVHLEKYLKPQFVRSAVQSFLSSVNFHNTKILKLRYSPYSPNVKVVSQRF